MKELIEKTIDWGREKGIFEKSSPLKQMEKTEEEVAELRKALEEDNIEEVIDALGDVMVTLILQAEMNGLDIEQCLGSAYNVISKRTGRMVDGIFVKDK